MKTDFDRKLQQVARRCSVNRLLDGIGRLALWAGVLGALAVLAQRLLGYALVTPLTAGALLGAGLLASLLWWFLTRPARMRLALLIDDRLHLKERFSTAMALAQRQDDPFAAAAGEEAHRQAHHLKLKRAFPIRPTRRWAYAGACWIVAAGIFSFVPDVDALGLLKRGREQQRQADELAQAKVQINQTISQVQATVKQLGDAQLSQELEKLKDIQTPNSQEARREAIRKLGDLADRIKEIEKKKNLDQAEATREILQQLKTPYTGDSKLLGQAMAKGDFNKASEILKDIQKKLQEGKLDPDAKQKLIQQLKELGEQLERLAQQDKQLEDELAKAGLDKGLADKSLEDLKKELEKQGLSEQQIQELLDKAAAAKAAVSACARLGKALNNCGGGVPAGEINPDDLAEIAAQLSDLEGLDQQMQLAQASLEDIQDAIVGLGGEGANLPGAMIFPGGSGAGPWAAGASQGQGSGTGGPGQGYGARQTDPDGPTKTVKTKVGNASSKGPIIASWYIKGDQVKGEASKQLTQIVQSAKDSAAQAVTDNEIPKKYEGPIKKYYGQFEQSAEPKK